MTTKEQERQAIEKIRKIVAGMGENSYLATAMDGVLEVAEQNIEYDAAFSLKGRAEVAEKEASELKKENEELRKALAVAKEQHEREIEQLGAARKLAEKRRIPEGILKELEEMVETGLEKADREVREAADAMADAIGAEGQMAAQATEAAERYRDQRSRRNYLSRMQDFFTRYREGEQE